MAVTPKALFRGAATTTLTTTLYTAGVATVVVTNIVVTNTAATAGTFDIALAGIKIADAVALAAKSFVVIDLKQVITNGQIIAGGASATTINFHISGTEIS